MIPALLLLKPFGEFIKSIPREVWYGLALVIALLILRGHWIEVGTERCEAKQEKAQAQALAESLTQEMNAPVIAQKAQDETRVIVEERIRYVQKNNTVSCDEPYNDKLQQAFRKFQ